MIHGYSFLAVRSHTMYDIGVTSRRIRGGVDEFQVKFFVCLFNRMNDCSHRNKAYDKRWQRCH